MKKSEIPGDEIPKRHLDNLDRILSKAPTAQVAKFTETARSLGCNESEAAFDAALHRVATALVVKPEPTPSTSIRKSPAKEG